MTRRFLLRFLLLPLILALISLAPAQSTAHTPTSPVAMADAERAGGPANGKRCRKQGSFGFNARGGNHQIKIGYAKNFLMSPHETIRKVKNVRKDMTVRARYTVRGGGSIGASGVAKLLVSAQAQVHSSLVAFGSYNKSKQVTVSRTVRNPTNSNKHFVAFRATHQYHGRYTKFYCQKHPLQDYPTWVSRGKGTWRSHESMTTGTLRCGAGTPGAVAAFVVRRHCR